jgi:hypothetical protein
VRHSLASWKSLFLLTFVTAYAYIFNEWPPYGATLYH